MRGRQLSPAPLSATAQPKVLLCIDDDRSILRYQRAALEPRGYVVVSASSAREGLRLALSDSFDGIIVDYQMPELNGHEVAAEIRRFQPQTPIIMFSAADVPEAVHQVINAFVSKLSVQQLVPVVAHFVPPARKQGPLTCAAG